MGILLFLIGVEVFELVGLESHFAAPTAVILGVLLGIRTARPIYSELYPQQIKQADENAITRLGLSA